MQAIDRAVASHEVAVYIQGKAQQTLREAVGEDLGRCGPAVLQRPVVGAICFVPQGSRRQPRHPVLDRFEIFGVFQMFRRAREGLHLLVLPRQTITKHVLALTPHPNAFGRKYIV